MNLIDKGVLPQNYSPPKNILLLPPLDYLNWIENLPQHFKYQVMLFSPSCSIEAQDEKVCLWGQGVHPEGPRGYREMYFSGASWATQASSEAGNSYNHISTPILCVPGPGLSCHST